MKQSIIFIVDYNPIHCSLIKYHLNINHFHYIHLFRTGVECMYRLQRNSHPDFLISDYNIGNYTGFDFLERVHHIDPLLKVIYFSSHDDPVLARRLLDAGATDYVSKTGKLEVGITELIKKCQISDQGRKSGF